MNKIEYFVSIVCLMNDIFDENEEKKKESRKNMFD